MNKIKIFLVAAALLLSGQSFAQTTKATIQGEISSSTANGLLGGTILNNIVLSYVDWTTCSGTGGIVYWNAGTPTCLNAGTNGYTLMMVSGIPQWTLPASQSANTVYAGPSSGSPATPSFRALVGSDLPNPSASTLGGVQSAAAVSNQWINSISTSGVPSLSQPGFTNLSGQASLAQLPSINSNTVLSNITGGTATPLANSLSSIIDNSIGSAQGDVLYRGASGWAVLAPGTGGQVFTTGGAANNPSWTSVSGTGTVTSIATNNGITGGTITSSGTIALANITTGNVMANVSGGTTYPTPTIPSAVLDVIGSTEGSVLYRGASTWSALTPGSNGQLLATGGIGSTPSWTTPPTFGSATPGYATASGGGVVNYLRADGTWTTPVQYNLTNLLSNTGFQYVPGMLSQTKFNNQGTGTLATFAVTSTSNSFNIATINITPSTNNQIKPNFLVQLGSGCPSQLLPIQFGSSSIYTALRVLTTTGSPVSSFTVLVPKYTGTAVGTGTCTGTVVTPTDFGTSNIAVANWLKYTSLYMWMENDPVNFDTIGGSIQVVGMQQRSSAEAIFYTTLPSWRVTALQSQSLTCGGRLMQKNSGGVGTGRFFINDSGTVTYGSAMPLSVGSFQSVQASITVSTTSSSISAGYALDDTTSSTFYATKPYCVAAPASAVPANFYSAPINEIVYPDRIHNVWDYSATTVTFPTVTYAGNAYSPVLPYYSFLIDMMGETNGTIHWTIPTVIGDMEGQSTAAHTSLITLSTSPTANGVIPGGPILWLPVSSSTMAVYYQQPLTNGLMIWGTGQSGTVLSAANLDLYGVILNTGPSGQ